ncbi:MAG: hypothetical protein V1685_06165 [Parcubacteria group bacterium]
MSKPTVKVAELPLTEVLISFSSSPPKGAGIEERERPDIDSRHRREALDQGVQPDRMRRGAADSGRLVRRVHLVAVDRFIKDLADLGFVLTRAWTWDTRDSSSKTPRPKTIFVFTRDGQAITLGKAVLGEVAQQWLKTVSGTPHDQEWIYTNPKRANGDGEFTYRNITVNLAGRKPTEKTRFYARLTIDGEVRHDDE